MIVDTLDNIRFYKSFPYDIYSGLKFLKEADEEIQIGKYQITKNIQAIVEEYKTSKGLEDIYESHRHVIDIQYPIVGVERVLWSPIGSMKISTPYNDHKDCTLFTNSHDQGIDVDIGNNIFAIMFPEDGHSPAHFAVLPQIIKKITIKISII